MDTYASGIKDFARQLTLKRIQFQNLKNLQDKNKPDAIVIAGMGGSGLVGTLLQNLAGYVNINVPLVISKDFGLPPLPYAQNPLYLFVSFSGNTKETLDGLNTALKLGKGAHIAIVAGGGEMLSLAKAHELPYATFEQSSLEPRQATGLMLYGALGMLQAVWESILVPDLQDLQTEKEEQLGKVIAEKIENKFPLIYTPSQLSHLGYYWKIQFNEVSKTIAVAGTIPEINHNEMVALREKPENVIALFIEDEDDASPTAHTTKITKQVLESYSIPTVTIPISGKTTFEKTCRTLILGEWTSYHLAMMKKVDPRQTNIINEIKKMMA